MHCALPVFWYGGHRALQPILPMPLRARVTCPMSVPTRHFIHLIQVVHLFLTQFFLPTFCYFHITLTEYL